MSEARDLAEVASKEAGVPFDREKYDHDEMLLVVRENFKQLAGQLAELRSDVRRLEAKLSGLGTALNYLLWITCLLLAAALFSRIGFFN